LAAHGVLNGTYRAVRFLCYFGRVPGRFADFILVSCKERRGGSVRRSARKPVG